MSKPPEVMYRPERPDWPNQGPDYQYEGAYYLVCQQGVVVAAYHATYYRGAKEVVADLVDLLEKDQLEGPLAYDYVVWRSGRVQAVVHEQMQHATQRFRIINLTDPGNDYGGYDSPYWGGGPYGGWPSYEQWVRDGRGRIILRLPEKA